MSRDIRLHGLDMWRQTRRLGDNRAIHIDHLPAPNPYELGHLPQKLTASDTFIFRIGIREVVPQIAEPQRTQTGITDGMNQGIGV